MTSDRAADDVFEAARARGRALIESYIADGTLITAEEASRRLGADVGLAPDAVVRFQHQGTPFYLACTLDLQQSDVGAINRALGAASDGQRLLWWLREHGALAGATVPEAVRAGRLARCVEIARDYAEEHGWAFNR